jgi:hypothetical protein
MDERDVHKDTYTGTVGVHPDTNEETIEIDGIRAGPSAID